MREELHAFAVPEYLIGSVLTSGTGSKDYVIGSEATVTVVFVNSNYYFTILLDCRRSCVLQLLVFGRGC